MFWKTSAVVISVVLSTPPLAAQEYFGAFLDQLQGSFEFEAKPRPTFRLQGAFRFQDPNGLMWLTPADSVVDGASIPQAFWTFIGGPFEGPYISASVIHDHYCRSKERTAHDTHRNFYYGMRANGVPDWKASLMYWAVVTFGPSWKLERRVVMRQTCAKDASGEQTCTITPTFENVGINSPGADLSDPEVLAAAMSKAHAIAKTLLTSNGKVLDVVSGGSVPATPDSIAASALGYRTVFENKEFAIAPAKLGVLASPTVPRSIEPWAGNSLPSFENAAVLTRENSGDQSGNVPFKAGPATSGVLQERIDLKALGTKSKYELKLR